MVKTPTVEQLFEAGGHLGHRKDKTDPSVTPYVYRIQNRISLLNLDKTVEELASALEYAEDLASHGKVILFVGTKKQLKEIIEKSAIDAKMPYMCERWIGGFLTNFDNIKKGIEHIKKLERGMANKEFEGLTKKERNDIDKEIKDGNRIWGGIKEMNKIPDAMLVFDTNNEIIAVKEAKRLGLKVIGINDMNFQHNLIDKFVPINDESRRAMEVVAKAFAEAIKEGTKGKE
jgi:small subunit ribosomal protein S2